MLSPHKLTISLSVMTNFSVARDDIAHSYRNLMWTTFPARIDLKFEDKKRSAILIDRRSGSLFRCAQMRVREHKKKGAPKTREL
jgi:hypothetical protein